MNHDDLQRLLDDVKRGALETRHASERILQALRAAPFEDLGFARVDTHREVRQGFPEVILGVGKAPGQIAAIADRSRGIGCDQVIALEPSDFADVFMRIWNADGGEVGACGNAARCVAALLVAERG